MAAPVFVNAGVTGGVGFGSGFSNMGMPASRVNGNYLIGLAAVDTGTARTMAVSGGGGGWAVLGTPDVSSNGNSLVFYRVVDGTESAPTISWTGNDNGCGTILQYSGLYGASPFGNIQQSRLTSANATIAATAISSLASSNSLVLGFVVGGSASSITITSAPGGSWTLDHSNSAGLAKLVAYDNPSVATQGSSGPSFSITFNTAAKWMAYQIELQSQAPTSEVDITASAALGISQAVTLDTFASISAALSLGISEAVTFADTQNLTASPALGVSESALVQLERDLTAAAAVGITMAAQLRAAKTGAQPVVCITT